MTNINKFIVGAVLMSTAVLVGGVALADAPGQLQKMVSDRLAEVAKVHNKKVCDVASGDDVACGARVVVDENGKARSAALPNGYGPKQFTGAYQLTGAAASNPGPIIAIVDAYDDPNIAQDLSTYSSTYGIPGLPTCTSSIGSSNKACFLKENENGKTTSLPKANASWDLEISLDVEAAHATCQNCRILLVEANSASFTDLLKAVDTAVASGATAVSGSWGANEFSGEASYDSHFNKPGVAFTFSAGDSGYGTLYPAASPYVTAVGGTTLLVSTTTNARLSESTWSGTGSGCSADETNPSWLPNNASGCANKNSRVMNDVSADADPGTGAAVYDTVRYDGMAGWFQVGGTSLSSPLIASVYALQGVPSGAHANTLPYSNSSYLYDVTAGTNGTCGTYLCSAGAGYDGPTGVGAPMGSLAF